MSIDPDRISRYIETIAGFNEAAPDIGYSRPTFSPAWRQARDFVQNEAEATGCKVRIDAAGNLHARHASIGWDEKVWLSGSHIDSVPTGGKFDGVVGIVCPLEVLRSAHAAAKTLPLELIIFAEEEGTTFGIGMIGSRLWTQHDANRFDGFINSDGKTYFEAGSTHGARKHDLQTDRFHAANYRGLIEVHIEQGPAMWAEGVALAVVTAIAGRKQYKAKFTGVPNHAGSTPMRFRADPLVAAAHMISGIDELARKHGPTTVATVGRIDCQPNAINVIPGAVQFTVDVRSPSAETLKVFNKDLEQLVIDVAAPGFHFAETEDQPPMLMDADLCAALQRAAGNNIAETISGALHDAAIIAPLLPTAMLFVASRDGVSHNPAEFSRIEDIAAAATVLEKLVAGS